MNIYGSYITKLIEALSRLPGIGNKSAQRLAFHIINMPHEDIITLSKILVEAKENIKYCSICCNLTDKDPCFVCTNSKREATQIMVVEDPRDMAAYERTNEFKGLYHILHGVLSPINGISPDDLKIKELLHRINTSNVKEIIIATNPNVEGEATAMYISKLLKTIGIKVTRIAHGIPMGGDLEFIDQVTLSRALEGRIEL